MIWSIVYEIVYFICKYMFSVAWEATIIAVFVEKSSTGWLFEANVLVWQQTQHRAKKRPKKPETVQI